MIHFSKLKHGDLLLNTLAGPNKFVPISSLMESLNLSRRSIFYLIKKVNIELDDSNYFEITNVKGLGYHLPAETINELNSGSKPIKFSGLSPDERKKVITFELINRQYSSLTYLKTYLSVSKNTIIRDLTKLTPELKHQNLQIINTNIGKKVTGSEVTKRRWVYEHADELITIFKSNSELSLNPNVSQQLKLLEHITGNQLTDDAKEMFKYFITWYLNRIKSPTYQLKDSAKAFNYSLVFTWSNSFLQDNHVKNSSEAAYLAKIINSRPFSTVNWNNPLIKSLRPVALQMIQRFSAFLGYSIDPQKNGLLNNLTIHLLSTYYRVKFDIQYIHPNLNQIKETYQATFNLTKQAVKPFEHFVSKRISDDETALIALYFGGVLRNTATQTNNIKEVFVVCSSGIGTSHLLLSQLRTLYPNVNFIGPMSVIDYENNSVNQTKLIISTIRLHQRESIPVVTVSAFPSVSEWHKIQDSLVSTGIIPTSNQAQINVEALLDIISTYSKIINLPALKQTLREYLSNQSAVVRPASALTNTSQQLYWNEQDIQYIQKPLQWQQAIQTSLQPLLIQNKIEFGYIQKIIQLIKLNGPYMVIGNGIMLAHASPRDGVKDTGACVSLLKHPVKIKQSTKPVKLIIGLASIDSQKHLKFLQLLTNYLQNTTWLKQVYESTNENELIQRINKIPF
ncbi:BglG family transcription antiterminator [Secundilactobacillus yichangensis]|uniref:BglG family transcription antiterminator n=1 Tax=Secundilactobacillus yichangensis TaxID=2799580 RepID=UPI001940584C|nr:PTS sugar transporter subunit IIA [Secundilactobacillus yichangensis]